MFVFSPPASAAYNKAAAIFITTAEYSCDWTQFGRTTNKAGVFRPKTLSHAPCAYGTTSEQVLWLAPYTPHGMTFVSCLLSFPMTGFRLRTQKQLKCIHRQLSQGIRTPFPFHRLCLFMRHNRHSVRIITLIIPQPPK